MSKGDKIGLTILGSVIAAIIYWMISLHDSMIDAQRLYRKMCAERGGEVIKRPDATYYSCGRVEWLG